MAVVAAEWRKLGLPGIWLVVALTVAGSWALAALMSGPSGSAQTLQLVPSLTAMGCILLGVLAATGEYSGRQVATTCTAMPRRFPVAVAKALTATVVLTVTAMLAAGGVRLLVPEGEWALPGVVAHLAAMGLLGYAIGLVARQLVASLTTAFVLLVVAGPVLRPYTKLATWLPGSVGADLFVPDPVRPLAESVGALVGWVLGFWVIAAVVWARRDA
jgi:membrane protein